MASWVCSADITQSLGSFHRIRGLISGGNVLYVE